MLVLPWNTDAPVYHWPFATVGLIATNIAIYGLTAFTDQQTLEGWMLAFGQVQWLTSCFLHAGFWHLLGNMVFLWAFGLVVEGQVGAFRFLGIYLLIGIVANLLLQIMGLGRDGGYALGASGAIFGIMGVALAWAPENELEFVVLFNIFGMMFRAHNFSARIRNVALVYLVLNFLESGWSGFGISGALAHLLGAALGFPLGWWFLNTGRVDCEGWDLFTLLEKRNADKKSFDRIQKRSARSSEIPPAPGELAPSMPPAAITPDSGEKGIQRLRKLLEEGKGSAALALYEKISHVNKRWKLPEAELVKLINLLHTENRLVESIPFLEDYLERFEEHTVTFRLRLGRILIEQQQRPNYALRVMSLLPAGPLPDALEKLRMRLQQEAQRQIDDGVLELEGKAWQ